MQIKIYLDNLVWFIIKLSGLIGLILITPYIPATLSLAKGLIMIMGLLIGEIILSYHLIAYIVPNPDKKMYLIELAK